MRSRHCNAVRLLFVALVSCLSWSLQAASPHSTIERLVATEQSGKVTVRFELASIFEQEEMVEALRSGLPTSFTYSIEIYRDRPNWFDDTIARSLIEVICTYNSVTREYLLNTRRDRKLVRSETFTDLALLQRHMTSVDEPELFDIGDRKPYKLKVRAKADLMRGWLMYVIPWEVSTNWREARVKTAEGSRAGQR
ncbi:MAG: DUF4390 domain-containing protein [Acidobacteriota bacterium]